MSGRHDGGVFLLVTLTTLAATGERGAEQPHRDMTVLGTAGVRVVGARRERVRAEWVPEGGRGRLTVSPPRDSFPAPLRGERL